MVEITLKRRARDFAEKHDVSYTRALAAVDEPLHRLRDALFSNRFARPGFQLIDSENEILEPLHPLLVGNTFADYTRKLKGTEIRPYSKPTESQRAALLAEIARRMELFSRSKVRHILEYRELQRAGLADENLDFLPHYYHLFGDFEQSLIGLKAASYGLIEVAVFQERFSTHQWRESDGTIYNIPVPESQLGSRRLKKITMAELQELLHPTES